MSLFSLIVFWRGKNGETEGISGIYYGLYLEAEVKNVEKENHDAPSRIFAHGMAVASLKEELAREI